MIVSSQVANFDMRCEHLEASLRSKFDSHNIDLTLLLSSATYADELSSWMERIKVAGRSMHITFVYAMHAFLCSCRCC